MFKTNSGLPFRSPERSRRAKEGQTLMEVLVVVTLLGLIAIPFITALNQLNLKHKSLAIAAQANLLALQNLEVVTNIAQSTPDWSIIPRPSTPTDYAPLSAAHHWQFQAPITTPVSVGPYQTKLTIQPICRNSSGELLPYTPGCPVTSGSRAIEVISTATWLWQNQPKSTQIRTIFTDISRLAT